MPISVTFKCGHEVKVQSETVEPQCPVCGDTTVVHVKAPPPRFRGAVLPGPCAEPE